MRGGPFCCFYLMAFGLLRKEAPGVSRESRAVLGACVRRSTGRSERVSCGSGAARGQEAASSRSPVVPAGLAWGIAVIAAPIAAGSMVPTVRVSTSNACPLGSVLNAPA